MRLTRFISALRPSVGKGYVSQTAPLNADERYVNGGVNCGPACMAMVARDLGGFDDLTDAELVSWLGIVGGTRAIGTMPDGIARMAEALGLQATWRPADSSGDIERAFARGAKYAVVLGAAASLGGRAPGIDAHFILVSRPGTASGYRVRDPAAQTRRFVLHRHMSAFIRNSVEPGFIEIY